ncbi:MAG: Trm112 family protein [Actinobacteria bacterium]|nr:Trm112 family protein [Actinomycetota bacterium]MCI0678424.1 Trm112 family protein [Actinomycetota bacterium]
MSLIDPLLAGILVCPVDKSEVVTDEAASRLVCTRCGRRYPVRDGMPIMLIEEAEGGPDE